MKLARTVFAAFALLIATAAPALAFNTNRWDANVQIAGTTLFKSTVTSTTGTFTQVEHVVASANAVTLPAGNVFEVTGTTQINSIGIKPAGTKILLIFTGSVTVTGCTTCSSAANILNAGTNISAVAKTVIELVSSGTYWFVTVVRND